MNASDSLGTVVREVKMAVSGAESGAAVPRVAKEQRRQTDLMPGVTYDACHDVQGGWDREEGAWRGRQGDEWSGRAGNRRPGGVEEAVGCRRRVRQRQPADRDA